MQQCQVSFVYDELNRKTVLYVVWNENLRNERIKKLKIAENRKVDL